MSTRFQPSEWTITADNLEKLPTLVPASFHEADSEDEEANESHVPIDVHQYFGLPTGVPIHLDSLQDPAPGEKPAYTYATLVKLAIWSSSQRKLTLSGIYEALERRFSWFRDCENRNAWKTSIRHNLSLMSAFVKLPADVPSKGCYWTVDFTKGEGTKRPRKRRERKRKKTLEPSTSGSEPSTSVSSPMSLEAVTPMHQSQFGAFPQERPKPGYIKPWIARSRESMLLAAASPDHQYRHYRMCTYLYPNIDGTPPAAVHRVWDLMKEAKEVTAVQNESDGPAQSRRRAHRSSRRSNPVATTSRRMLNPPSQPATPEAEYFRPSTASYLAYRAASSQGALGRSSDDSYVWQGIETPASFAKASSDCTPSSADHGSSSEDDRDGQRCTSARDVAWKIGGGSIPSDFISRSPPSPSPPVESEYEEEDT